MCSSIPYVIFYSQENRWMRCMVVLFCFCVVLCLSLLEAVTILFYFTKLIFLFDGVCHRSSCRCCCQSQTLITHNDHRLTSFTKAFFTNDLKSKLQRFKKTRTNRKEFVYRFQCVIEFIWCYSISCKFDVKRTDRIVTSSTKRRNYSKRLKGCLYRTEGVCVCVKPVSPTHSKST